eukprot:CAMPEP_0194380724 /NCGR_PEP_ID=MMETSP0174-20130528/47327_1 /TAXON_ID=216777 /ORGANISM="Proboscia alata, Strain PI-D3" /LENGTH=93 /DNA_ID=CAMNT_0039164369 /DNA_START=89 /DNA_END=369 /DNA_ORIENTATION=-
MIKKHEYLMSIFVRGAVFRDNAREGDSAQSWTDGSSRLSNIAGCGNGSKGGIEEVDVVARGIEEVGHAKSAGLLKPTRRAGRMRDERTFSYNE